MFSKCKSLQDVKTLFRKLSLRLHPDSGGSHELMLLLQEAYQNFLESLNSNEKTNPLEDNVQFKNVSTRVWLGDHKLSIVDELFKFNEMGIGFNFVRFHQILDFLNKNKFVVSSQYNELVQIYYDAKNH